MNKRKIINDPVYDGFLAVEDPVIMNVIEHPFFQRQRRIKQLGLTYLVYPGAMHTRFSHMLGALNLMGRALNVLRQKGVEISDEECRSAKLAILLHDIGHGPFSHTSERVLVDVPHEEITLLMMERMKEEIENGSNSWSAGIMPASLRSEAAEALSLCIAIFKNVYHKHFLHQLVSSQLDMDRLDYLGRDSFFTGVSEGIVGTDRIISMLNVHDDELVIDEKGIYSVEKFIISRRLMYWQVYMHKTVIAADNLLLNILRRAKEISVSPFTFHLSPFDLDRFAEVDDDDIMVAVKQWQHSDDKILSTLCRNMVNRHLPAIRFSNEPFEGVEEDFFHGTGELRNRSYDFNDQEIKVLYKDGRCLPISEASDQLDRHFLEKQVTKYFIYFPKETN